MKQLLATKRAAARTTASSTHRTVARPARRACQQGQNLVELALTLPFVIIMLFFILELGRAWFVYEGAKLAAVEGAHAAAIYQNATVGTQAMQNKLAAAGLTSIAAQVTQVQNQHAYKANVTVTFKPFFGGVSIPTLSGPMSLIPSQFNISYNSVEDLAVY